MIDFDGKSFINEFLMMQASKSEDKEFFELAKTFQKYNLNIFEGLALMTEVSAIMEKHINEGGEKNDD